MEPFKYLSKSFKNKPFSLKSAEEIGISRHQLNQLLIQGKIEKVAHGIYGITKGDISPTKQFKIATALIGQPSVICLLSALEYYDLTDIISKEIWLMVPLSKRSRQPGIRLFRTSHLNLNIGILKTSDFFITSIDRTIIDCLTHKRQIPTTTTIEALRRAIHLKKTTLSNIVSMAKKIGVLDRIYSYIEAMA